MTNDLIARIESADGPSRELDWLVECMVDDRARISGPMHNDPRYTASIDAALTLVPDKYRLGVLMELEDGTWAAKLFNRGKPGGLPSRAGATPALALAAAALKARSVR